MDQKNSTHPLKIAVVIGAIGVRALAAIPLFEYLDEAGIEVDLLVGSSGGAMPIAWRGVGYPPAKMRELAAEWRALKPYSQIDYRTLIGFAHPRLLRPGIDAALKKSNKQRAYFQRVFGDRRLENLRPETVLQATNCITGEGVVLTSGLLADAVYASNTMAPYFPPAQFEDRWLVDGAYTSPVPIIEAVKRHADVIIVLFHEEETKPHPEDLLETNFNILAAFFRRLVLDQIMLAVEMHHHEIIFVPLKFESYVGPWQIEALPEILRAGEKAVARCKEEITKQTKMNETDENKINR